jgi:soluble lytic murein transglycosylase-like protein
MRGILASSVDCKPAQSRPPFPCRPGPRIRKRSPGLQRKRHIRLPHLIAWRHSLRPSARLIVMIMHVICLIATSSLFASRASAQTPERPPSIDRFANFIAEASARFTVPAPLIRAIIQIESAGDDHAISPRGAMGLMQLTHATWVQLSVRYELGLDPFDPKDNIMAGTAYVRELRDRLGSADFLGAYHAGPTRYEQHLMTRQPLPPETAAYVAAVTDCSVTRRLNTLHFASNVRFLGGKLRCSLSARTFGDLHPNCSTRRFICQLTAASFASR